MPHIKLITYTFWKSLFPCSGQFQEANASAACRLATPPASNIPTKILGTQQPLQPPTSPPRSWALATPPASNIPAKILGTQHFWQYLDATISKDCLGLHICTLTSKSSPIVSYCQWIFSARSSNSRTIEGFSRDIALLSPEETIAGQVCTTQSQSWIFAKHTPLWFPRRQYKAPWREQIVGVNS